MQQGWASLTATGQGTSISSAEGPRRAMHARRSDGQWGGGHLAVYVRPPGINLLLRAGVGVSLCETGAEVFLFGPTFQHATRFTGSCHLTPTRGSWRYV